MHKKIIKYMLAYNYFRSGTGTVRNVKVRR